MPVTCEVNYDDPSKLADAALIGANKLADRSATFKDWSAAMTKELGPDIKPFLRHIYDRSQAITDHLLGGMKPKEFPEHRIKPVERSFQELRGNPALASKTAKKLRQWLPKEFRARNDIKQLDLGVQFFKENKLANYRMAQEYPWAEASDRQYEGYNVHAQVLAKKWSQPLRNVKLAEAVLSPQKSPDASWAMTERMIHGIQAGAKHAWDEDMSKAARSYFTPLEEENIKYLEGKKYTDLTNPLDKAMWLRAFDEANHDPYFRMVKPDGTLGDFERGSGGRPTKLPWTSNIQIAQAVRALEGAHPSKLLLTSKIGNYYNSGLASGRGDYTVDTHDAAAGFFQPLSANDERISFQPLSGIQALQKEAGIQAAKEAGIASEKFQAGVWTHQRNFFSASALSSDAQAKIAKVWKDAHDGKLSASDAREQTIELARRDREGDQPEFFEKRSKTDPQWLRPRNPGFEAEQDTYNMGKLGRPSGTGRGTRPGNIQPLQGDVRGYNFINDWLKPRYEEARANQLKRAGTIRFYSGIPFDPAAFKDEITIGAYRLAVGTRDFAAWSKAVVADLGDRIKPYLKELYNAAQEHLRQQLSAFSDKRLEAFKSRKTKAIADIEQRTADRNVSPRRPSIPLELDAEARQLQDRYDNAIKKYNEMLARVRLSQRPWMSRALDSVVNFARAAKLMGTTTLGKLGGAVVQRQAQTFLEERVGQGLSLVPGLRKVMKSAPTEGPQTLESAMASLKGFHKGIKSMPQYLRGEKESPLAQRYGQPVKVPSWLDIPARIHGAEKAPALQAGIEKALVKARNAAEYRGEDTSNPAVAQQIKQTAYEYGRRQILVNRNVVSDLWNNLMRMAEQKQGPGQSAAHGLARLGRFLIPIARVPVNLAMELGHMSSMGVPGAVKLAKVMVKGVEGVRPDELDFIARNFKKGAVGAALFAMGYYNADKFGGVYVRGRKQKGDLKWGQMKIGDVTIPWWLQHSPMFLMMQLGATIRHSVDEKGEGFLQAAPAMLPHILEEQPFLTFQDTINNALNLEGREGTYARGRMVQGMVPGFVRNIAEAQDQAPKRYPQSLGDYFKMSVPGLRQQVSTTPPPKRHYK